MRAICDHVGAVPKLFPLPRPSVVQKLQSVFHTLEDRGPKVIFDGVIILSRASIIAGGPLWTVAGAKRRNAADHCRAKCSAILMMNAAGSAELRGIWTKVRLGGA